MSATATTLRPIAGLDFDNSYARLGEPFGIRVSPTPLPDPVLVHFNADAAQWVASEEWHAQQKARWLADGRYELQVPYSDPTELAMDILRHGDSVVVVGDKALAALIGARLQRAAARYETHRSG